MAVISPFQGFDFAPTHPPRTLPLGSPFASFLCAGATRTARSFLQPRRDCIAGFASLSYDGRQEDAVDRRSLIMLSEPPWGA